VFFRGRGKLLITCYKLEYQNYYLIKKNTILYVLFPDEAFPCIENLVCPFPRKKNAVAMTIKYSIQNEFMINLTYESWDNIFTDDDVNTIFNNFLHTYLRNFYSSFPVITTQYKPSNKVNGIKTFCLNKRELYLISRNTNNPKFREHYKSYCKIFSNVIKAAKNIIIIERFQFPIIQIL